MNDRDKVKLRDAFNKAVAGYAHADTPTPFTGPDGKTLTYRTMVDTLLASDQFYAEVDRNIAKGMYTLDEIIDKKISEDIQILEMLRKRGAGPAGP